MSENITFFYLPNDGDTGDIMRIGNLAALEATQKCEPINALSQPINNTVVVTVKTEFPVLDKDEARRCFKKFYRELVARERVINS